jgi:hypothetical protein
LPTNDLATAGGPPHPSGVKSAEQQKVATSGGLTVSRPNVIVPMESAPARRTVVAQ